MSGISVGAGSLLGKRIGRYEVLALLALGGTSEIYLARIEGTDGFQKYVVVKCMHAHLASDAEFRAMFRDEARVAAQLDHTNVVQTLEFGEYENRYYIVMEFLAGLSLAMIARRAGERMSNGRIPTPLTLNIIAQAAAGLHYAHERAADGRLLNIVHRDVSPQNLVISFEGVVKLVDFGIAKWMGPRETRTRTGTIKGKFAYMSPEQCITHEVDHRTDVFALGVIAHELLTGRRLFKRPSPYETYQAVLTCEVEPPSKLNAGLDLSLDTIVMRAVAKDKERRFSTAGELRDAILRYLHESGISAGPDEISRFFETSFGPEIDEHRMRIRDMSAGHEYVADSNRSWGFGKEEPTDIEAQKESPPTVLRAELGTSTQKPAWSGVLHSPLQASSTDTQVRMIGQYRVTGTLGEGGVGVVYAAEHRLLGRPAAIKVLLPAHSSTRHIVERFFNEARAATAIHHPGIVEVYDFGWTEDGAAFIVMELLRGETLGARLKLGAMAWTTALTVARQIAGVLSATHAQGIIHRDLKPDNVFLVRDPEVPGGERIKLLDFGIAKLARSEHGLTQVGALIGTPTYMAPEQCRGADIDSRTDLYALGCILFELCTGRPPFIERSVGELLSAHLITPPPPMGSLVSGITVVLDRLTQRLLAKSPNDRVQTAEELLRLIDAVTGAMPAPLAPRPEVGHTVATFFGSLFRGGQQRHSDEKAMHSDVAATLRDAVKAALPPAMKDDAISIAAFIRASFGGARPIRPHVLELERPELPGADAHDFYCIFVSRGAQAERGGVLGTRVFAEETKPLEEHLTGLKSDQSKVVVAVLDTPDLARGVRRQIVHYRRQLRAIVLVTYIGELRKLLDDRHRRRFFSQQLDSAAPGRPFGGRVALREPTEFIGSRHVVDELVEALRRGDSLVLVSGIPGSGKSSLVNMAYFELEATQYVRIRCSSQKSSVDAFCRVVAEELGTMPSGDTPLRKVLSSAVHSLSAAAKERGERAVLVFEDADWLVTLTTGKGEPAQVDSARVLWTELADLAATNVVGVIATAVRGFVLKRRVIGDWENPFATHLTTIHLRGMNVEGIADLATSIDVSLDDAAATRLHSWSGGHVDLARRICDRFFDEDCESRLLARHDVSSRNIDRACNALVAEGTTFRDSLIPWLDAGELAVLQAVSRARPRSARALKKALTGEMDEVTAGDALEHLREMGLVVHSGSRETVTIQLLAKWIQLHGASQSHVRQRKRDRRMMSAAIIAAALLLVAGAYGVWLHDRINTSAEFRDEDCVFRFKYPQRAAQGDTVKLYVFRECSTSTNASLVLGELDSTVATIDQRPLKFSKRGSRSERADVSIVLDQTNSAGNGYRFALEREVPMKVNAPLGELEIMHDSVAGLRSTLEGAAKVSMAALSAMLLILSLQRRILGFLRRVARMIRGRDRKSAAGPRPQARAGVEK